MKFSLFPILMLFAVFTFQSCSKKEAIQHPIFTSGKAAEFLTLSSDAPAVLQKIAKAIAGQESRQPFLENIIKEHGYAAWKHSDIRYLKGNGNARFVSGDTLVTIPFLMDSARSVNAILICLVQDSSIRFTLMKGKDYHQYGFRPGLEKFSASFAALQLMHFDHKIFGDSLFLVTDGRLFNNTDQAINRRRLMKYRESTYSDPSARIVVIWDEVCQTVINEGTQGQVVGVTPGGTPNYHYSEVTCVTITTIIDMGGGFGGGGGSGGGGGVSPPGNGNGSGGGNPYIGPPGGSGGPWYPPVCGTCIPEEPILPETPPVTPVNIDDLYDPDKPFENPDMPVDVLDDPVFDNGFEINDVTEDNMPPFVRRRIAHTDDRGNVEDMQHGTGGNTDGIKPPLPALSNDDLLVNMSLLFLDFTALDVESRAVGRAMIDKFIQNTGGSFSSANLNKKVSESSALKEFLLNFGDRLKNQLSQVGGNIDQVNDINMGAIRPIFNSLYNKFHGLQIILNDTEFTEIHLDKFTRTSAGKCTAIVTVSITDHFGLDKHDALLYQDWHNGFAAWWLLQHTRDFVPFLTKIQVQKEIIWQE